MKLFRLLFLFVLAPSFCFSWNDSGHMTAGAVAYYYLKQNNPAVLQKVLVSLQQHPWYTSKWSDKMAGLTAEQKDVALFMLASTWPDEARKDSLYGGPERAKWHYINYPVSTGEDNLLIPSVIPTPNAEGKLAELETSLKGQADSKEKAVNLCWLFHIVEDIHQPLHTVALFDARHPEGDKGGNDTYIVLSDSTKAVRLHGYWDGLVPGTFSNIPQKAQELLKDKKYKESKLKEIKAHQKVTDWTKLEGIDLARTTVYNNVSINGTQATPTRVDKDYIAAAKTLGEKRVVISGIRLAKKLAGIYS